MHSDNQRHSRNSRGVGCPKGFYMGNLPYDSCCRKYHFSDKERVRLPLYLRDKITNQMCYACTKTYFCKNRNCKKKVRRSRVGRFQLFSSEMEDQKKTLKPARLTFQSCHNTSTLDEISHLRDNNSVGVIAFKTMFKSSDRTKSSMFNRLQARSIQGYAFFKVVSQDSRRWFSKELV